MNGRVERRINKYKNIYDATNPTAPYVVIEAASGAHISHQQSYGEGRTAMRQYETATTKPMPKPMPMPETVAENHSKDWPVSVDEFAQSLRGRRFGELVLYHVKRQSASYVANASMGT